MGETNKENLENLHKKPGLLRRLAGRGLQESVQMPAEEPKTELTPDGIEKSVRRVTIIDPSGEKPAVTKTYRNW